MSGFRSAEGRSAAQQNDWFAFRAAGNPIRTRRILSPWL